MISERQAARRIALQGLYQLDVQGDDLLREGLAEFISEATDDPKVRDMALVMARSAWVDRASADLLFGKFAEKWPIHRMATVDRNILRLAAWELTNVPDTPPKVVLDEAINIAREYSTADSPPFINGILDAVLREHLARTGQTL
jgi:N utilization substance protein B